MKIQPSIQTPGYWARSACGHEHLFKGLTHVIIDLVVGFFGFFFLLCQLQHLNGMSLVLKVLKLTN